MLQLLRSFLLTGGCYARFGRILLIFNWRILLNNKRERNTREYRCICKIFIFSYFFVPTQYAVRGDWGQFKKLPQGCRSALICIFYFSTPISKLKTHVRKILRLTFFIDGSNYRLTKVSILVYIYKGSHLCSTYANLAEKVAFFIPLYARMCCLSKHKKY